MRPADSLASKLLTTSLNQQAMADNSQGSPAALPASELADFCGRWQITALEMYGSGSRGDLRPDSDLDFLVTFRPGAEWSLFDHVRMKRELERSHNRLLREEILSSARVIFSEADPGHAA